MEHDNPEKKDPTASTVPALPEREFLRDNAFKGDGGRAGAVTGARIVAYLAASPASSGTIALALRMEESYVRRTCRMLLQAGILTFEVVPQKGTPPLKLYSLILPARARDG